MDLERALSEVENGFSETDDRNNAFDITVKNGQTGAKEGLYVTPENTLGQVFNATATALGFNVSKSENIFVNERTGQSSTDSSITLKEFQVLENNVISVEQDGKVAAY